jgi:hypothetical protein
MEPLRPTLLQRARLILPMLRLSRRFGRTRDPWARLRHDVPPWAYGPGSTRPFPWYFEGETAVRVGHAHEVAEWLLGCAYATDQAQFRRADHWQHPAQLERRRAGDCEDLALWAWRKLAELGHESELHCGRWRCRPGAPPEPHAWVVFRDGEGEWLMECTARTRAEMCRPLGDARGDYLPRVAVDHRFRGYLFGGLFAAG